MILLDTHVLAWMAAEPSRLSGPAVAAVRAGQSTGGLAIASITLWELAMLLVRGKLRLRGSVESSVHQIVEATGVVVVELTPTIAALSVQLPETFPKDPADRLIAATALAESAKLITADRAIRASGIADTIW